MKDPFSAVSRAKKTQEAALQKFGKNVLRKYQAAKKDFTKTNRYKNALSEATKELSMPAAEEKARKTAKRVIAKPRKK